MAVRNGMADEVLGDEYPFQDHTVSLPDGRQMHYIEMGRAGLRRPTFLLLHGNPTWSFLYRRFMAPLSRLGRVIAVDHVGFGRSDHPTDVAYYTLEQHIQNLEHFVAALGLKRVVPVVQDWGGPIGLGYATRHPEDLAGLVIMNTWAFTKSGPPKLPFWFKALTHGRSGRYFVGKRNMFVEKLLPRFTLRRLSQAEMDAYRHPFPTTKSRAGIVAFPQLIPTGPDHPEWPTMDLIEDHLKDLDVPAAILWANKDPAFPKRYAHRFHEMLPQAESPVFFEASHYLQEDVPADLVGHIAGFASRL